MGNRTVDNLYNTYCLYVEIMRSPTKGNYISLLRKIKGAPKIPLNIGLLDFKTEIDNEIADINRRMLRKIGLDMLPDGLK